MTPSAARAAAAPAPGAPAGDGADAGEGAAVGPAPLGPAQRVSAGRSVLNVGMRDLNSRRQASAPASSARAVGEAGRAGAAEPAPAPAASSAPRAASWAGLCLRFWECKLVPAPHNVRKRTGPWRWTLLALVFAMWTALYFVLIVFGSDLLMQINIGKAAQCVGNALTEECATRKCATLAISLELFSWCGFFFFLSLATLSSALRYRSVMARKARLQAAREAEAPQRARRGGSDQGQGGAGAGAGSGSRSRSRSASGPGSPADGGAGGLVGLGSGRSDAAPLADDAELEHDALMDAPELHLTSPESNWVQIGMGRPPRSPSKVTGRPIDPAPAAPHGRTIRPFRFLQHLQLGNAACCRKCCSYSPDAVQLHLIEIRLGDGNGVDASCVASWSAMSAQCCMFPWFVLLVLCSFTVLLATPNTHAIDEHDLNVCGNITMATTDLNTTVEITWFVVMFTWAMLGGLTVLAFIRTAFRKLEARTTVASD
jgi:hypothetical protein